MLKILGLFAAAACLCLGLSQTALAQPAGAVAFAPGAYLTVDDVTFSVSSTAVGWNGTNYTGSTACSGGVCLYMAPGTGSTASIVIEAAQGSTTVAIDSLTCSTTSPSYVSGTGTCSNGSYDLSATITAKAASGGVSLTGASVIIGGSASPTSWGSDVGGHETLSGETGCSALTASLTANDASCTFAKSTSVSAVKDFGLTLGEYPGDTVTLMSVTESFTTAPEPASVASLLFGVIALAGVRRQRRRA